MSSTASREERTRERIAKNPPSVEAVADASIALLCGFQTFRFLYEAFNALDRSEATLTLSADGAAGLARICDEAGMKLMDAYGPL